MSLVAPILRDKVAIVTGSARGLGQAISHGLALAGADVVGADQAVKQDETREKLESTGRLFVPINVDITAPDSSDRIIGTTLEHFKQIDVLVNNAGISRRASILDLSEADWDDVLAVNLRSCFILSQKVARHFVARQAPGSIINIASLLSFQGSIRLTSYTVSKTGLVGLTRAMANELAPHNIRVNAIAPGYMETENTAALRQSAKRDVVLSMIPLGRWGKPEELQGPVVFLASDMASYITGQVLVVDGGCLSGNL